MNTMNIKNLIYAKGEETISHKCEELNFFSSVLHSENIREYLSYCLTREGFMASGVRIKSLEQMREENEPEVAPGGYIFPYGYLVIATSIGGNVIGFHADSGIVFWADHTSFSLDEISYKDRKSGKWIYLPFSKDNIMKATVHLDDSIERFLLALFSDKLEEMLDTLE